MRSAAWALVSLVLAAEGLAISGYIRRSPADQQYARQMPLLDCQHQPAESQIVDVPHQALIQHQDEAEPWAQHFLLGITGHDFGAVPHGVDLKHRFKMKNIYAVPMQITSIRHSCGCVTFNTSHPDQKPLAPGEEGWIEVEMDSRRFTGYKKIRLYITVGPKYVSTAVLDVAVDVRADGVSNPGRSTD